LEINYNSDDNTICEGFYVDDLTVSDAKQPVCDVLNCSASVPAVAVDTCTESDLCTSTSLSDGVVDTGDTVTYTVTLKNTGTGDAIDVQGNVVVNGGGTLLSGAT